MMNAACVRLMMFRMPQTIEKPSPTRASMKPWSTPLRMCWRKSRGTPSPQPSPSGEGVFGSLPLAPLGRRPDRLGVRRIGRPDGHLLAVLPLLDSHRLEGVDAALVELDGPVERHEVELGDR